MVKYTIENYGTYIVFVGQPGTIAEGKINAVRKSLVKKVEESNIALVLIFVDRSPKQLIYTEYLNPQTGFPFTSLLTFKLYILSLLNSSDITDSGNTYLGAWNAITNKPALANGAIYDIDGDGIPDTQAVNGSYFIVTVADENLPANNTRLDGENGWLVGDYVMSTGTMWIRQIKGTALLAKNVIYEYLLLPEIANVQDALDYLFDANLDMLNLNSLTDVDLDTFPPSDTYVLTFDQATGQWGAKLAQAVVHFDIVNFVDGTQLLDVPSAGQYAIRGPITRVWAEDYETGDIIYVDEDLVTTHLVFDTSNVLPWGMQVHIGVNLADYAWSGSEWQPFDAYEPNSNYLTMGVVNTTEGDLSKNPYSAAPITGENLRGLSMSKILDRMLFTTIPYTYIGPEWWFENSAGFPLGGDIERGTPLDGTFSFYYQLNDGGTLNTSSFTIQGATDSFTNSTIPAIISGKYKIDIISGSDIIDTVETVVGNNTTTYIEVVATTNDGDIQNDNKDNPTPRNEGYGDDVLAFSINEKLEWVPRYAWFYGYTTNGFKIAPTIAESTDISINPNSGTIGAGTVLDESWLRSGLTGITETLFIDNTTIEITSTNTSKHVFIATPPGISISTFSQQVFGNYIPLIEGIHYSSFTTSINDANGENPKSYTVYYLRGLTNIYVGERTFRVTTTGTVIP